MMYVKTLYVNSLKGFPDTSAGNNPPALIPQLVTIHLQCRKHQFDSWVRKIPWRRERLPTPVFLGFPCGSADKESACNVGDLGRSLGWEDPRRRERRPTPVFQPGEFQGLCSPWGHKESVMTERLSLSFCRKD